MCNNNVTLCSVAVVFCNCMTYSICHLSLIWWILKGKLDSVFRRAASFFQFDSCRKRQLTARE